MRPTSPHVVDYAVSRDAGFRHKAITDARLGENQCGTIGILFQLTAEPGDVHAQVELRVTLRLIPHMREELLVRECVMFEAHDVEREVAYFGKWTGVVRPSLEWTTEMWPGEGLESSRTTAGAAR